MRQEELAGKRFGRLLVIKKDENKKHARTYWLCQCDCGTICSVSGTHLKTGHTKSCGCYRKKRKAHGWMDLSGERYGRLLVLGPWKGNASSLDIVKNGGTSETGGEDQDEWICRCDCGNICVCQKENLRMGKTKSCGCLQNEQRKVNMQRAIHFAENTCVERIASRKTFSNNTSGHRGVYKRENGTWRASIGFQGKVYNLGSFKEYEEAVKARLEAEKQYYDTFLQRYQEKAAKNHEV